MKNKKINFVKWLGIAIFLAIGFAALFYSIFGWPFEERGPAKASLEESAVHFIDCGHGDSILVISRGEVALIDTGTNDGGKAVAAYLKKLGIRKIDRLILTHPHGDHIGGAERIMDSFEVESLFLGEFSEEVRPSSSVYLSLRERIGEYEGKVILSQAGDSFSIGAFTADVLGPVDTYNELNDQSMVIRLEYGETSLLLAADQQDAAEKGLMETYDPSALDVDVLKIGHHGSEGSTSAEFLAAVSPEYGILCCGENPHGHPYQSVLDRIEDYGLELMRTDRNGTIVISTDGSSFAVESEK